MNSDFDVIVIGGGIAGTAAALSAAEAGARTALVSARPGATALCGGGWRGSLPPEMSTLLRQVGYHIVPTPAPLPLPNGAVARFDECHTLHAIRWGGRTLVCGINGMPAFHAESLARSWSAHLHNFELAGTSVTVANTPAAGWAPASLARAIERSVGILCDAIAPELREVGADTLLVPAVLGLQQPEATRAAIESRLGVQVFEAPGGTPCLPGWRLRQALEAALEHAEIPVFAGRATGAQQQASQITAISVEPANHGPTRLVARSFVLATGKFVGGGIAASDTFSEPVFDLPVWIDHLGERFTTVEPLALTNAERRARQPLLYAGVVTDEAGRPVGSDARVLLQNVFVAGVIRAEMDGSAMNLGHVATDGWAAGARAAA